ncbi:GNAT family N-acetyltransferase [Brachybacterium sp. YJGR34]|uniref:GNAT family N-acetyltransferase n=1 Tax=Brachybacterium sp. YJGR34 TaxID=2059911 RepID=UPI000E0A40E2|nr:GNAT family N-acetyltransferase [Brachybacterium sp. YJGR34]
MDVRLCSAADLKSLTVAWPAPGGVHEAHTARAEDGSHDYLVAGCQGEPLGSSVIRWTGYEGGEGSAAHPDAVEVCHLQVRPEYRGQCVGTALIKASERRVLRRGRRSIAVGVADDNPGARKLYERLGFRPTGIIDVSEYEWVDADGATHHARECDQMLLKELRDQP